MSTPWIKRPVVWLGITFNVIYLFHHLFGGASDGRPARPRRAPLESATAAVSRPSWNGGSAPSVYPAEDLTLVREPGRRLLFSPVYTGTAAAATDFNVILLRFYSFSKTPQYDDSRPLRVTAGGREVWSSYAASYSFNYAEKGEVVESLICQMPLEDFARAVGSNDLRLTVGREEIQLTSGQLESLRRVVACAYGGSCG